MKAKDKRAEREKILADGIALTTGDRNKTYGPPAINLGLQWEFWESYRANSRGKYSQAHEAAMQHVFAKIARIATAPHVHRDNYVDAATYLAIAYECDAPQ